MKISQIRSILLGERWTMLPISAALGLGYAPVMSVVLLENHPPRESLLFMTLIPITLLVAYLGGGLLSAWLAAFSFAEYAMWKLPCIGLTASCVSQPGPIDELPSAVLASLLAAMIGYGIVRIADAIQTEL